MATKPSTNLSLWDQLPKAEQQRLTRMMADKAAEPARQNGQKRSSGFNLKGYVRCELSSADKEAFKAWEGSHTNVECYERLIKAGDSGYLLKIGDSGNGHQASLSAANTGQYWDGYVLVAHASTSARAAMLLVYKHEVLMQSDWSQFLSDEGEDMLR